MLDLSLVLNFGEQTENESYTLCPNRNTEMATVDVCVLCEHRQDVLRLSGPHDYNTTAIQEFFSRIAVVLHLCGLPASEMTYIVSGGALNSTHSLTHCADCCNTTHFWCYFIVSA